MAPTLKSLILACAALALPLTSATAQDFFGDSGQDRFRSWFSRGEQWGLCRQSIALSGVEDDMDDKIRSALGDVRAQLERRGSGRDRSARIYEDALAQSLSDAKQPILRRLTESCASTFTISELRGINAFYASAAGRAWLRKGRTIIMPQMEQAIADVQPRIRDDIERHYCERAGC